MRPSMGHHGGNEPTLLDEQQPVSSVPTVSSPRTPSFMPLEETTETLRGRASAAKSARSAKSTRSMLTADLFNGLSPWSTPHSNHGETPYSNHGEPIDDITDGRWLSFAE